MPALVHSKWLVFLLLQCPFCGRCSFSLKHIGDFPMDCPLHDSLLRVHYKGMVLDEEKRVFYDSRVDNDGQPLEFCSGEGLVSFQKHSKLTLISGFRFIKKK